MSMKSFRNSWKRNAACLRIGIKASLNCWIKALMKLLSLLLCRIVRLLRMFRNHIRKLMSIRIGISNRVSMKQRRKA